MEIKSVPVDGKKRRDVIGRSVDVGTQVLRSPSRIIHAGPLGNVDVGLAISSGHIRLEIQAQPVLRNGRVLLERGGIHHRPEIDRRGPGAELRQVICCEDRSHGQDEQAR